MFKHYIIPSLACLLACLFICLFACLLTYLLPCSVAFWLASSYITFVSSRTYSEVPFFMFFFGPSHSSTYLTFRLAERISSNHFHACTCNPNHRKTRTNHKDTNQPIRTNKAKTWVTWKQESNTLSTYNATGCLNYLTWYTAICSITC